MPYADRVEVDAQGNATLVPVDNTWILANRENYLALSGPGSASVGVGFSLTAQLKTPLLVNDTRNNVSQAMNVPIIITLETEVKKVTIALNSSGTLTDNFTAAYAGTLTVRAENMPSDVYTVEVT
jgi:hypothetical protein